jgi:hypothetical protein
MLDTPCRDLGHSWALLDTRYLRGKGHYLQTFLCHFCTSEKERWIDTDGYITRKSYKYADNYLREPGTGRMSRDEKADLRLSHLKALARK